MAEYQLKTPSDYDDLKVQLASKGLDQKAVAATVNSRFQTARLQADRDKELAKEGLIPDLQEKLSTVRAENVQRTNWKSSGWLSLTKP